ncbi:hypothetical protein CKAH01_05989 [Colletotrichum kahawae]|uniref:Uncharacterized protein n=1 Tax=Colletotrichum kahawae TaxID=34407 RepID=A0AAE0D4Y2_COLKA|nr:hypothetical protein CKAH01_05989 [Colletotrichum kahawae]
MAGGLPVMSRSVEPSLEESRACFIRSSLGPGFRRE